MLNRLRHYKRALERQIDAGRFWLSYGTKAPPAWSDLTGYGPILRAIDASEVAALDGDVLEIGVFLGGGTVKLCSLFAKRAPGKRVVAVDIFDPDVDHTATVEGREMTAIYSDLLKAHGTLSQRQIFDRVTSGWENLVVIAEDSLTAEIPAARLCFAMIDGNHTPQYVHGDFETAWSRLVPGGLVAMHDYGYDLPDVTHTINACIGEHASEIARVWTHGIIAFIQKEPEPSPSAAGVG
jgi:Methyltransferase domain